MYVPFQKAAPSPSVENTGSTNDQLVPAAMPRYGAAASRHNGGTCRNRGFPYPYVRPSVRDDNTPWSYVLAFPRFRVKKRITSTVRALLAHPYSREVRWGVAGDDGGGGSAAAVLSITRGVSTGVCVCDVLRVRNSFANFVGARTRAESAPRYVRTCPRFACQRASSRHEVRDNLTTCAG